MSRKKIGKKAFLGTVAASLVVSPVAGVEIAKEIKGGENVFASDNLSPVYNGTVPQIDLTGKGDSIQVDLNNYFKSRTGGYLTYTIENKTTDEPIIDMSIDGSILSLNALKKGRNVVRITAHDSINGLTLTQSATVFVSNTRPILKEEIEHIIIPGQTSEGGVQSVEFILEGFDPDEEDRLIYAASSFDRDIVRTSQSYGQLIVTGMKKGQTTIKVIVYDETHSTEYLVPVTVENSFPKISRIDNQVISFSEEKQKVLFEARDVDGQPLTINAISTDENIATIELESLYLEEGNTSKGINNYITITPHKKGQTTIKYSVEDSDGAISEHEFNVTVENAVPKVTEISDQKLRVGENISTLFAVEDKDLDDNVKYEVIMEDETLADVSINLADESMLNKEMIQASELMPGLKFLTLDFKGLKKGSTKVTLKISDDESSVERTFNLTVETSLLEIATEAVELAEDTLIQKNKDNAQLLVNDLDDSDEKTDLQNRLDVLQELIDSKEKDFLDKFFENPNSVTPQDLADYIDDVVYEELMDEYIKEMINQDTSLNKDTVIQIVHLINTIEKAKRSMNPTDIAVYANEYNKATISLDKYPNPETFYAIATYVQDGSLRDNALSQLSNELGLTKEQILENCGFLVDNETVAIVAEYKVQYVLEDGTVVYETTKTHDSYGIITVEAEKLSDYLDLVENESPSKQIQLIDPKILAEGETLEEVIVQFVVKEVNNSDSGGSSNSDGGNLPSNDDNNTNNLNDVDLDDVDMITDDTIDVDNVVLPYTKSIDIDVENIGVSFEVSSGPSCSVFEGHKDYVLKTYYALEYVKMHLENPTEESLMIARSYIISNLLDGEYKSLLLGFLNLEDESNSNLTPIYPTVPVQPEVPTEPEKPVTPVEPEKPVTPTEPNKPNKPIGPTPTEPVTPTSPITPSNPTTPTEEPSKPVETTKVVEVIKNENGKFTVENPIKDKLYEFNINGFDMKVPFEHEGKLLEIELVEIYKDHYKLLVKLDGKEINTFKKAIELSKVTGKQVYIGIVDEKNGYAAYNHSYNEETKTVSFDTKTTEHVFFFNYEVITFKDIQGHYAQTQIEELASRFIVYGKTKDIYAPNESITRGQFAAMVARAFDLKPSDKANPFTDVKGKWYADDVQALYETGIIFGTSNDEFNGESVLTRQQAALMMQRLIAKYGTIDTNNYVSTFVDNESISKEAQVAVGLLEHLDIVNGKPGHIFDANSNLTRGQMGKMFGNVLKYLNKI